MPLQISYHLATVLLIETLRVGAAVLLIAGAALVGGSILTEYHGKEPREGEGDPYVGFGFIGAVGLGAGAMLSSIPLWIAYRGKAFLYIQPLALHARSSLVRCAH
jgi:hypothetical protein